MRCIASFTLLASALSLAACTDADTYLAISDAPGALDEPRDEIADWSESSGSLGFYPAGTLELPALVTLRIEGRHVVDSWEENDPLRAATLDVVDGSACRITRGLTCAGGICFAELELTTEGLCMVRATGTTHDGAALDTCWFRGSWTQDPADPTQQERFGEMADAAWDDCLDG